MMSGTVSSLVLLEEPAEDALEESAVPANPRSGDEAVLHPLACPPKASKISISRLAPNEVCDLICLSTLPHKDPESCSAAIGHRRKTIDVGLLSQLLRCVCNEGSRTSNHSSCREELCTLGRSTGVQVGCSQGTLSETYLIQVIWIWKPRVKCLAQ